MKHQPKMNYSELQRFMIIAWGELLYLDYDSLPNGTLSEDRRRELEIEVHEFMSSSDDIDDIGEWIAEGMPMRDPANKRYYLLPKTIVDEVLESAETVLTDDLIVYKTGNGKLQSHRWISTTMNKGAYSFINGEEVQYTLRPGDKVIFANGLADRNEVILNSVYLKTSKQTSKQIRSK